MRVCSIRNIVTRSAFLLMCLGLVGCAGGRFDTPYASGHYESDATQCVPYARQASGIQLYGDAYTWWDQVSPPATAPQNLEPQSGRPQSDAFQAVLSDVTGVPSVSPAPPAPIAQGQANARYRYGFLPQPGAVLVLAKTPRLTRGHVAVVKRVVNDREIDVTQSNWGSNAQSRRIIYESQRAQDVSAANDWSLVKFWNRDANQFGFPYQAKGFIYR